ncbi:transmembrane protein 127 [Colossoma macropomum]|uniref:transmembrane protein 127 n=1 Tax=Colossoma macropomum TaxID=42526 RepID=UPI001863BF1E|nr:transmembrane protein 127 [Colossoma macropomum]
MTLSLTPAAMCQCFTLVSLCTSIADPNWINVQNGSDSNSKQLIYGVAFTLRSAQNLTHTGPLGGVNGLGMRLLYTLAAMCYSAVLLSSSSFFLDFLGAGFSHSRLVSSLHVSTALLCLVVLGVSGACLYVIQQNVQKEALGPSSHTSGLYALPGESFFIEILALFFSLIAVAFSFCCPLEPIAPYRDLSEESVDGEGEREPLIGGTGKDGEAWGEGDWPNTD